MSARTDSNLGTMWPTRAGHFAQFSVGHGARKGTTITKAVCPTEAEAERRRRAIAALLERLRESGHTSLPMLKNIVQEAGAADVDEFRKLERVVERIASGKEPDLARQHDARREGMTVEELAKAWWSSELAKEYPDHVKVKQSADDDKRVLGWVCKVRMADGPTFGSRVVSSVTLDDCEHLMSALPKSAEAPATRRQYAQAVRKLLTYAVYPLRLLSALPIPKGWLPKGGTSKAKAWVYPVEDLALMRTKALKLTWRDLDLERGVLRLDDNKTEDPRSWVMGADVTRALKAWKELRGAKAKKIPAVFPKALVGSRFNLARWLREGLELAGVTRPELLEGGRGRMRLRAHDLRGTYFARSTDIPCMSTATASSAPQSTSKLTPARRAHPRPARSVEPARPPHRRAPT